MGLSGKLLQIVVAGVIIFAIVAAATAASPTSKPGCPNKCGDVEIPYPFGLNKACYLDESFNITCDVSGKPMAGFVPVTSISIENHELHVLNFVAEDYYDEGGVRISNNEASFWAAQYTISSIKNKLIVLGCDTYAYLSGFEKGEKYSIGCSSQCSRLNNVINGSCFGVGCCEVGFPNGLKNIQVDVNSFYNHTNISGFNPCGYAFVVEKGEFNFSSNYLKDKDPQKEELPVVLDWAVGVETCEKAKKKRNFACQESSKCLDDLQTMQGYRCNCKQGYKGNPYLHGHGGCKGGAKILRGQHSLISDKAALLAFKKTIILDPNSTLANWDEAVDVCNFTGVMCNKQHHRVVELILEDKELVGLLSPCISNLTGLRNLVIIHNRLFGNIPAEFSSLRHLHHLRLDFNNLGGSIPDSFSLLSELTVLHIQGNNISGTLPHSLFSNCTLLSNIDFSENSLTGKIPEEIGNCPNLWSLNLYNNNFTGQLPFALTNVSLYNLDVEYNHLSGELPSEIVSKLPGLVFLHLSYNPIKSHDGNTNLDPFFIALGNCTSLEGLELAGMGLGGQLPISVGRLGVSLIDLQLQENQIYGSIPPNLGNLSELINLNLTFNLLNGTIPVEISRLSRLDQLFLSHNFLPGAIPSALGKLSHLGLLDLSNNKFSGEIPASLGNLVPLNSLFLNNNLLSGTIPPTLGQYTDLYRLDLSYNRLTGSIPPEFSGLRENRIFINLSHNHLEGPLPIEHSKLENVQEIDLSSNKLTGTIFPQISSFIALRMINISDNSLQGHLPESIGELRNLEILDLSRNNLSGMIPVSLNKTQTITYLNLSFNNFEGSIPTGGIFDSVTNMSFLENHRLCRTVSSRVAGIPICRPKRRWLHSCMFLIIFVLGIFISVVLLSTICCAIRFRRVRIVSNPTIPELIHNFPRITHKELSDATAGFDEQNLIGSGSYGRIYRGVLSDGTAISVKVLHVQSGNSTKSFNRECQVLKRIRHRNLIRIITVCSLPDFKALILPYMANGSLDSCLHNGSGSSDLSLIQRVNICSDIAEGMAYLHHHSPVRVIHCDLKPSNVLLNDDMTALVSDFG